MRFKEKASSGKNKIQFNFLGFILKVSCLGRYTQNYIFYLNTFTTGLRNITLVSIESCWEEAYENILLCQISWSLSTVFPKSRYNYVTKAIYLQIIIGNSVTFLTFYFKGNYSKIMLTIFHSDNDTVWQFKTKQRFHKLIFKLLLQTELKFISDAVTLRKLVLEMSRTLWHIINFIRIYRVLKWKRTSTF